MNPTTDDESPDASRLRIRGEDAERRAERRELLQVRQQRDHLRHVLDEVLRTFVDISTDGGMVRERSRWVTAPRVAGWRTALTLDVPPAASQIRPEVRPVGRAPAPRPPNLSEVLRRPSTAR